MRCSDSACPPFNIRKECTIPSIIGFIKISSVQIAAIPIVPTPIKRTFVFQTTIAASIKLASAAISPDIVKYGTATPQVKITPINIAIPPTIPIK